MIFSPNKVKKSLLISLLFLEACGIMFLTLIFVLVGKHLGGVGWSSEILLRNWHVIIMPIAAIFLTGNSIISYRAFRKMRASQIRYIHSFITTITLFLMIFAWITISQSKIKVEKRDQYYSLHSWIGLTALILYFLQYIGAVIVFIFDTNSEESKASFATVHSFFGLINCILFTMAGMLGLEANRQVGLRSRNPYDEIAYLTNFAGFFMVVFIITVIYISINPYFEWEGETDTHS